MDIRSKISLLVKWFVIIPIILIIIGVSLFVRSYRIYSGYKKTDGTIIDFYVNKSPVNLDDNVHYAVSPIVSYTAEGREYERKINFYHTGMEKGDKVELLYNPDDPSKAVIKSGLFFAPLIVTGIGIVLLIIQTVFAKVFMLKH